MSSFRPMRRHRQQLSDKECVCILERATSGTLALLGDDDYPYAVPISFVYHEGCLYFHSAVAGHKVDAIRRHDKASFCVIDHDEVHGEQYTTFFRSVIAFGRIRIIEDEKEKLAAARLLGNRYNPNQDEALQKEMNKGLHRMLVICLEVEHLTGKEAIELTKEEWKNNIRDVKVSLIPLQEEDREQFILDNQRAFKYGAQEEFGMRDERCEEGEEVISRGTIEQSIDGENAETYRIVVNGENVGGIVLSIDKVTQKGELELLFVNPDAHSKGIGQAAWKAVEQMHPEIQVWETITPYFEKRNIHFYVNRCGFHIVEFWNRHFHGPAIPEEEEGNWSEDDEMFLFRKIID